MTKHEDHCRLIGAGYQYDGDWFYTKIIDTSSHYKIIIPAMGTECLIEVDFGYSKRSMTYRVNDLSHSELSLLEKFARVAFNLMQNGIIMQRG